MYYPIPIQFVQNIFFLQTNFQNCSNIGFLSCAIPWKILQILTTLSEWNLKKIDVMIFIWIYNLNYFKMCLCDFKFIFNISYNFVYISWSALINYWYNFLIISKNINFKNFFIYKDMKNLQTFYFEHCPNARNPYGIFGIS